MSAGRLVWEKGHQDVLRALAAIRGGVVSGVAPRLLVVGSGPEEERLWRHARDLGVADLLEVTSLSYDDMPSVYARASALVLASLPMPLWEEQFGMVLAEAMAAGVPVVAAASGAIPQVVRDGGTLFPPGDWVALARLLAEPSLPTAPPSSSPSTRWPQRPNGSRAPTVACSPNEVRLRRHATRRPADRDRQLHPRSPPRSGSRRRGSRARRARTRGGERASSHRGGAGRDPDRAARARASAGQHLAPRLGSRALPAPRACARAVRRSSCHGLVAPTTGARRSRDDDLRSCSVALPRVDRPACEDRSP